MAKKENNNMLKIREAQKKVSITKPGKTKKLDPNKIKLSPSGKISK